MGAVHKSAWVALIGGFIAVLGAILYTQLDRLVDLKVNDMVLNGAALASFTASLGGSLMALVASTLWARRAVPQYVLRAAVSVGAATLIVGLLVNVNIHGPSAILMFLIPLGVLDAVVLFCIFVGREAPSGR